MTGAVSADNGGKKPQAAEKNQPNTPSRLRSI
jgi:hypothetical protein